jgi:hypothetical protein
MVIGVEQMSQCLGPPGLRLASESRKAMPRCRSPRLLIHARSVSRSQYSEPSLVALLLFSFVAVTENIKIAHSSV